VTRTRKLLLREPFRPAALWIARVTQDELTVLTKPKIIPVAIEWLPVEQQDDAPTRYVVSGAVYQRLVDAIK
jgi:hypothetical protein